MLKFLLNYPIIYYTKALLNPNKQGPDIAFYLSAEKQMLLVQGKKTGGILAWKPNLKAYIGSPTLTTITKSEIEMGNPHIPSSFKKELVLPLRLMAQNNCHLIIEDNDLNIALINCDEHKTIKSLKSSLEEDPADLIPLWGSYNTTGEYKWEILDLTWRTMADSEPPTKKVFAIGYPEEKIKSICQWAKLYQVQLLNILPAEVAVNRLIQEFDKNQPPQENKNPKGNYFLIFCAENEATRSYFTRGETLVYNPQKTREGINITETVEEIEDIQDQEELPRNTPIHIWGIDPEDYLMEALKKQGWTNIRLWHHETLLAEDPILIENNPEGTSIEKPEPWLLKFSMK